MVKSTIWPHKRNPYDIYSLVLQEPRLPITQLARKLKVNPKTAEIWWNNALKKQIIMLPRLRRKSFLNFREYIYFLRVKDPQELYEQCIKDKNLTYFSVHTGFCNFEIISRKPIDPDGEIVLSGPRSDYHVTIPPDNTFQEAGERIVRKLTMIDHYEPTESILLFREEKYEPWDYKDEKLYEEFCNDLRKPLTHVMRKTSTYSDKIMNWYRTRNQFGHTITMFFPQGLHSYMPVTYALETEFDSVLIYLFSELPTPCVFYRIDFTLMMSIYLPFFPSPEARILPYKILSILHLLELFPSPFDFFLSVNF